MPIYTVRRQTDGVLKRRRLTFQEYEAIKDEIVQKLRALRYPGTGEPVFDLVAKREEIYDGDYVENGPDILTVPQRDRYRVVTKVAGREWHRQPTNLSGHYPSVLRPIGQVSSRCRRLPRAMVRCRRIALRLPAVPE